MSSPRVWFITGASTGFGRMLTELILKKGEKVVATARKPAVLDDLVAQYPDRSRLLVLKLDVTQPADVTAAFAEAERAFGRLDVVVNNAGYAVAGEVEGSIEADVRNMFDTNFWGTWRVSREALRFFREVNPAGAGGRLLQISSIVGIQGTPGVGFYSASKHALEGLSEALAAELDPAWNIKITIISPSGFSTTGANNTIMMPPHPAYSSNPQLPTTFMRGIWSSYTLPGDATKAVDAIYRTAGLPEPPLHLVFGEDAVVVARKKADTLRADVDKYAEWSKNTNLKTDKPSILENAAFDFGSS